MPRLHRGRIDLARGTPTLVQAALQHKKKQAMQCKKAMQQFAHGSAVAAAKLRAALDEFEACASTSATRHSGGAPRARSRAGEAGYPAAGEHAQKIVMITCTLWVDHACAPKHVFHTYAHAQAGRCVLGWEQV